MAKRTYNFDLTGACSDLPYEEVIKRQASGMLVEFHQAPDCEIEDRGVRFFCKTHQLFVCKICHRARRAHFWLAAMFWHRMGKNNYL